MNRWILTAAMASICAGMAAADDLKTGERLYRSKCKTCHGGTGEGINPVLAEKRKLDPASLSLKPIATKSDDEVLAIIRDGKDKMPGYGESWTEEQLAAVLAYCRSLVPFAGDAE